MRRPCLLGGVFVLAVAAAAQEPEPAGENVDAVAARVQRGGWLESSRWQRGTDGRLEFWHFADQDDATAARFVPLLGAEFEAGFAHGGLAGWLSLVCHGDGDLLGMTDAAYHFTALGVEASDVGLRQFLALPMPSFDGGRGRAELLDRCLAIDVLERRRCRQATVELEPIARGTLPDELRQRARRALATLAGGTAAVERRRLTAETLLLPVAFDGCVAIDHARLPDMTWVAPLGRRLGALVTVRALRRQEGISPAQCNGAQRVCDVVSELPFGFVHRFGNARLDHSVVVIQAKAGGRLPLAASWQAAGAFEAERLRAVALPPERVIEDLKAGTFEVTTDHLVVTTDGKPGKPRPQLVEQLDLLRGDDAAIRVLAPANSKLWLAAKALELPAAAGAEVAVAFGDPGVLRLSLTARDDEGAAGWVEAGRKAFAAAARWVTAQRDAQADGAPFTALVDALRGARCEADGTAVRCTIEVRGITPATWCALVEALLPFIR
jgi:hypothetical protein